MPFKKDAAAANGAGKDGAEVKDANLLDGFTPRDQKYLAAALLSCTGVGKVLFTLPC